MIFIGSICGGPWPHRDRVQSAIRRVAAPVRGGADGDVGSLDLVFHVAGSILPVDFERVRTGRFSRRRKLLQVQIAVPDDPPESDTDLDTLLLDRICDAIRLGAAEFASAGIPYPVDDYLARVEGARQQLASLTSREPSAPASRRIWLPPCGEDFLPLQVVGRAPPARMSPILHAENEAGESWEDPSEDMLFILLDELGPKNSFLIVERLDAPDPDQTYMQVLRLEEGGYIVECRYGAAERHYQARARCMRKVHRILAGWAHRLPGWQHTVTWASLDTT
jgi:hypothetical protein